MNDLLFDAPASLIPSYLGMAIMVIINIITIFLDLSIKHDEKYKLLSVDIRRRNIFSIVSRLYFILVYFTLWILEHNKIEITTSSFRLFLGRWGLFGILFTDSYCHIANYVDYNWPEIKNKIRIIYNWILSKIRKSKREID